MVYEKYKKKIKKENQEEENAYVKIRIVCSRETFGPSSVQKNSSVK